MINHILIVRLDGGGKNYGFYYKKKIHSYSVGKILSSQYFDQQNDFVIKYIIILFSAFKSESL